MKISFPKKINSIKPKKDGQVNHHRFWIIFMTTSIIIIIIEIVFFTYLFIIFSRKLDSSIAPKMDTNSSKINSIEKVINKTEKTVFDRMNLPDTSQNDVSIVQ